MNADALLDTRTAGQDTAPTSLHGLHTLVVGDLSLRVDRPTDRKTIEIVVGRDGALTLKAPAVATVERATRFVTAKRDWIYRKLVAQDALCGPPVVKQFVEGEGFAYLGRNYRLTLTERPATNATVRLERGRFHLPAALAHEGALHMRRWYTATGRRWLRRRIRPWASRLGAKRAEVEVRELGYRWGSAHPTKRPRRINIHWATVQLPPSLIDYVLVHELAHLQHANHTPEFWQTVARLMPAHHQHKATLATAGKTIWLGAT